MTVHQRPQAIDPAKLDKLAEVAIRVGLNLQPGQDLFLTAPVAALPLVRLIAAHAYKAGAGIVTPMLADEEVTLARYRFAPDASSDKAPAWLYKGVAEAFSANTARLAIVGDNPMLLANEDPAKVGRADWLGGRREVLVDRMHQRRERDFGTGYGASSGYASKRNYASDSWRPSCFRTR